MEKEIAIKLLQDIVQINSTNGNEKEVADYLAALLKKHGIESTQVEYSPGRNQLLATITGNEPGPVLGFTGHMDVVPVGDIAWKHDPFAATIEDGKLYGRGACDMKSGLMAMVIALIEIKESGLPFKGSLQLLATVGEETSAIGAGQLVKQGYAKNLDALVIGEPTALQLAVAHKGALWPKITTFGKTAHGSMPENGVNAVEHMLLFLNRFKETMHLEKAIDDLLGTSTSSIDVLNGGKSTNVIPDTCTVEIDIRTIAQQKHQTLKQQIEQILQDLTNEIPDFKAKAEYINDLPSVRTEPDDSFVVLTKTILEQELNQSITPLGGSGYTDGSQFTQASKKFPIIVLGPGNPTLAHQPEEYVELAIYLKSIEIFTKIAQTFLKYSCPLE